MPAPTRRNHGRWLRSLWFVPVAALTVFASAARTTFDEREPEERSDMVIEVRIAPPAPGEGRWGVEEAGLVTALLEDALLHLDRVVPSVLGAPPLPSLSEPLEVGRVIDAEVRLAGSDPVAVSLTLCERENPEGCWTGSHPAPEDRFHEAVAVLVAGAAPILGSSAPATRPEPPSSDPYAVLLLGRAAAALYGMGAGSDADAPEDEHDDPVARAVRVDSRMAIAQGLAMRAALDKGDLPRAIRHADARAQVGTPVQALDLAAVTSLSGRTDRAARLWKALPTVLEDPRFAAPALASRVAAGEIEGVLRDVHLLPDGWRNQPAIVAIEVSLHDRAGDLDREERDALLARWQYADPADPAPVRERLALRASSSAWDDVDLLADALEERADPREAARWRLVAALALDEPAAARRAALATGDFAIAASVERRFADGDPLAAPGPNEAERARVEAERALALAEDAGRALGDVQNAAVLAGARCDPSYTPDLAVLGSAHREAVEAAGARWVELAKIWDAPTLAPLRDAEVELTLGVLHDAARRQVATTLEVGSWFLGNGAMLSSACAGA